ncbi:hypothetical protein NQ317_011965 [Molorchus minor]|uniref:Uncharacterized protein n=1 Tax=Molorchus minor TaxID=1323400 RepID=A0ABQ9IUX8_9CUCU|nr:hypothetical protein NQ317_011965 [Molorchus minor]
MYIGVTECIPFRVFALHITSKIKSLYTLFKASHPSQMESHVWFIIKRMSTGKLSRWTAGRNAHVSLGGQEVMSTRYETSRILREGGLRQAPRSYFTFTSKVTENRRSFGCNDELRKLDKNFLFDITANLRSLRTK